MPYKASLMVETWVMYSRAEIEAIWGSGGRRIRGGL